MEIASIRELTVQIIDFCISKYGAFILTVFTFFFPVVLYIKCKYEERINRKMRNKAISSLLADDEYVPIQDEAYKIIQEVSVDYDYRYINLLFKEKLGIENDFIVNGVPLFCDDSKIIPWQRLLRSYDIFNRSLCSGFWSLFLSHFKMEIYKKVGFIQYFKNVKKTKSVVLFELINGEYSKIYRLNLK
jgi:hypothetical protein